MKILLCIVFSIIGLSYFPSLDQGTTGILPFVLTIAIIGPSGVRALPLAAGINVGGHYWSERVACASGAT